MAKLAVIVTNNIEETERLLAQKYTKSKLIDDLRDLSDGDIAITCDQGFEPRAVMSLEVSAHVFMVVSDRTFNRTSLDDLIESDLILVTDPSNLSQVMRPDDREFFYIGLDEEFEYIDSFLHE